MPIIYENSYSSILKAFNCGDYHRTHSTRRRCTLVSNTSTIRNFDVSNRSDESSLIYCASPSITGYNNCLIVGESSRERLPDLTLGTIVSRCVGVCAVDVYPVDGTYPLDLFSPSRTLEPNSRSLPRLRRRVRDAITRPDPRFEKTRGTTRACSLRNLGCRCEMD